MKCAYTIHSGHEPPRTVVVSGKRPNWFLDVLVAAGECGATSLEHPGVRLSDAVMKLRRAGFVIDTLDERHGGPFQGIHGRYVLRSNIQKLPNVTSAQQARASGGDDATQVLA